MDSNDQEQPTGKELGSEEDKERRYESQLIPLEELVYASIQPLAASNQRLQMHILEQIQAVSQVEQREDQKVAHLKNLNVSYDKIRPDGEDASRLERVELQLPLLSIVPLSQLTVEKANVEFHAEIATETDEQGNTHLRGRASAPKDRKNGCLSRISYQIELKSIPAAEGLMRLTDLLDVSPVARGMDQTPLDSNGQPRSQEEQVLLAQVREKQEKIRQLQRLYKKVQDLSAEQERLSQLCEGTCYRQAHEQEFKFAQTAQNEMLRRIIEEQEELIRLEVEHELGQDSAGGKNEG